MFLNFKIDYIKIDHRISDIEDNVFLSNSLNGLTNLDEKEMQKVLQKTSDIAAKEGGFKGTLSIYNDDSSTKGYAYSGTLNDGYVNIIGFNTKSNNLTDSKEVINTLFHETTNKSLHHSNEQKAINRGESAANIWELKNYRHHNNNSLSTKEWNERYSNKTSSSSYENQSTLYEGNMLNLQSKASNGIYGERDERTIFVHGTNLFEPAYSKEFAKEAFSKEFREASAKVFNDPHQEDFIWSGENNKPAREQAAKELLKQIEKPYKYEPGESLNIIAHSHGGNVVKQMSHYYDYTQDKIPTVVTIATPNRKDYTMDPHIKEYYNVYNTYDPVQGILGGTDYEWRLPENPHHRAKEPNAVNVRIKGTMNPFTAHSDFKNPETMQILQKEMEKRRGK